MMDQYHPSGAAKRKLKGQREVGHGGSSAEGKITLHHPFFFVFYFKAAAANATTSDVTSASSLPTSQHTPQWDSMPGSALVF